MIKIFKNKVQLENKFFLFPAGEVGVKLDPENYKFWYEKADTIVIIARIQNSNDLFELALVKDALERKDDTPIELFIPYFPYARQDRVCVPGESLSVKVFANFINSLNFNKVTIVDPHSNVTSALINNVKVITQHRVVSNFSALNLRVMKGVIFVAPDKGAVEKTTELVKYFGHGELGKADKVRDLATGKILSIEVDIKDFYGRDVIIADDICDAGGTFIGLAKKIKERGAGKVILYVTHGIFTKGTRLIFEGGIDEIYTTNSYYDIFPAGIDNLNVFDLEKEYIPSLKKDILD